MRTKSAPRVGSRMTWGGDGGVVFTFWRCSGGSPGAAGLGFRGFG
jgi:hypothetical protein